MPTDKEVKKEFRAVASKNPEKYYAVSVLQENGFLRQQCKTCGKNFWSVERRETCDDASCSGGFRFLGNTPATEKLDYIQVWKRFASIFSERGYTPIARYPVVARWRKDTDFVQASIYDFQPYVVSGEVEPPANPLVVPQFCLRFNDIDNVGITGAHYTGFDMIGQHAFMKPADWNQVRYFGDIHNWLTKGLGLPTKEIVYHEDAWAGGGNFGPCMEFFSRGLELGNQVYMLYEQTPSGPKELKLKVLDMGMGHERNAWFTQGRATSYESTFPTVLKNLRHSTGLGVDEELTRKFIPYASYLNVDEAEDMDKAWQMVAHKIGHNEEELKAAVLPQSALYSVAEHSRTLLIALADGAIPSNVGGMYNLRVLLRRAQGFIDHYGWNVTMQQLCEWHADYLRPLYPELVEHLDDVRKVMDVEIAKYRASKDKIISVAAKAAASDVDTNKLVELYDTQGIAPELIQTEARKLGKKIVIPDNFYQLVAARHEQPAQDTATKKEEIDLPTLPDTNILYYDDWERLEFNATVLHVKDKFVVLDQTAFYPTSGGQLHDIGKLGSQNVVTVFKQGGLIVHVVDGTPDVKTGDKVKGSVDMLRRRQLAQHHSATHIVNAAARRVLGSHINQASAKKELDKAHLDITHYDNLSEQQLESIEKEANRIVKEGIPTKLTLIPRTQAEKAFGMTIYQGGAVPGKVLRIVQIPEVDVEACAGTHVHNTHEVGEIKLLKSSKVQDGVIRITFVAGDAARKEREKEKHLLLEIAQELGVDAPLIPEAAKRLFDHWKKAKKAAEKKSPIPAAETSPLEISEGNLIEKAAAFLQTQPDHVLKTLQRFKKDISDWSRK
jgi:alanyl-tRNA synthetase